MSIRNERARTDERHLSYIDLLDKVAVFAEHDPVAFERIRLNLRAVREWFSAHTGWSVYASSGCIRLVKLPARALSGHGFAWERMPSPRDYAMATWVLWYGEAKAADQFTLTTLAKEIQERSAEVVAPGYVDWNVREHRAALRNALLGLEAMRIIQHVDGDLRPYVDDGSGDALYEFTALAPHLQIHLPDTLYEALVFDQRTGAIDELPSDDNRLEFRCYRTLLLCPALFASEEPEVFAHLVANRRRIAKALEDAFGWTLEVTGSYACVLRSAQDTRGRAVFPTQAGDTHLALLLANALRAEVVAGSLTPDPLGDTLTISVEYLERLMAQLAAAHRQVWSAELAGLDAPALAGRTLETLRTWGMADGPDTWNSIRILPVLGRFAGVYRADGAGLDIAPSPDDLDDVA